MNGHRPRSEPGPLASSASDPAVERTLDAARRAGLSALRQRLEHIAALLDGRTGPPSSAHRAGGPRRTLTLLREVERLQARLAALGVRCDVRPVPGVLPRPQWAALVARRARETLARLEARDDAAPRPSPTPSPADGGPVLP